jgi:serine/threonine-protein kinase
VRESLASVSSLPAEHPIIIGRYALFDEIGSGGMATVYFGRLIGAAGFARQVAIKRLAESMLANAETRAMFVDEARLGARIHHPNVVQTLDVVGHGDELLIVMEYVHGETLSRLAKAARAAGRHVPVPIALAIVIDMLQGLHAAHEARTEEDVPLNIVHRDVSPQNVLVGRDGVARVLDFGIAHADVRTEQPNGGLVRGKVAYMSPEQLMGETVTRQTDVFSVGVVLWELLTGRRLLVAGEKEIHLIDAVLRGDFEPPSRHRKSLDPAIEAIVMSALDGDPGRRFATASEMARTLEGVSVVATSTQVGEWVQSLAGDSLAERGRKISAFERAAPPRAIEPSTPLASIAPMPAPEARSSSKWSRTAWIAGGFALGAACALAAAWLARTPAPTSRPAVDAAHVVPALTAKDADDGSVQERMARSTW